jgi:hypothetical protein
MSWLAALATARNGLAPNGLAARPHELSDRDQTVAAHSSRPPDETASTRNTPVRSGIAPRPSGLPHSPHAHRPVLCKRCHARPWNGGHRGFCAGREEMFLDLMREFHDRDPDDEL